ncbi:hypothetical protein KFL_000510280 [Klebsormidium nitens]|uniref:Uncharacterized protein n=1 Tax=Klebsormidium nitens TaxID=105231 RepID=A0A1Y1HUW3_KLENI|nr:hypothetical protein KFL_000510280 [Klebsormidium nitens]|eukprot:GAQ80327.1 hypothetical protein KFL_000510280 [Klebsormidium nitens]
MFTDTHLSVNAHMFGLPPDALIVEQRTSEVTPFYEGTWMDGMGFLYRNAEGAVQRLAIWLDRSATAYEKFPFSVYFEGKALGALDAAGWTSTDGIAKVVPSSERDAGLLITLKGLLEVEISRDFEEELFTDPPVQFLNLAIKSFTQGPSVHGFVGQMFREGAVEERLAMGTLEGLLHREYVEGTDDEYEASDLVSADCSFDLFSCQVGKDDESGVGAARKLLTAPPLVRDTLVRCAGPRYGTFSCRM